MAALLAPVLAPHDPQEQDLLHTSLPPAWAAGGCGLIRSAPTSLGAASSRLLVRCARIALYVAVLAAGAGDAARTTLALLAAVFGGRVDGIIGRAIDVWMAFLPVILALILLVGLGAGVHKVILAIILVD